MIRGAALLLLLLPGAQESTEQREILALAVDYLDSKSPEEKAGISWKLDQYRPSAADLAELAKQCNAHFRRSGPIHDGRSPARCGHPKYKSTYIAEIPAGARKGDKTGVFISLHGGGAGAGEAAQIQRLFGLPAPDLINVYPTVCEKTDSAWNTEREEQFVLSILDELKRAYVIDTNRVYLAGHSMGGYGTWSIGGNHPDLFAALGSMAGGVYLVRGVDGILANLRNTPIWFYHSSDDPQVPADSEIKAAAVMDRLREQHGAFDFVWKLYPDQGHGIPPDGIKPIFAWMLQRTRDPHPRHVVWESARPSKRHFYWLKKNDAAPLQVVAKRDGNRIELTGATSGLTILLNDRMVDFSSPVTVHSGERELFHGYLRPSAAALVESFDARHDPEMLFTAWIRLD